MLLDKTEYNNDVEKDATIYRAKRPRVSARYTYKRHAFFLPQPVNYDARNSFVGVTLHHQCCQLQCIVTDIKYSKEATNIT